MTVNIEELKAKSKNNITLINHSKRVADIAKYVASNYLNIYDDKYLNTFEIIEKSALLHDIGKATSSFQKILNNVKLNGVDKNIYTHNEIGWAVLSKILNNTPTNKIVRNIVLWHHGIYKNDYEIDRIDANTIIKSINAEDINIITNLVSELLPNEIINDNQNINPSLPKFLVSKKSENYDSIDEAFEQNELYHKIRTCIVTADRVASIIEEDDSKSFIVEIENSLYRKNELEIKFNERYDLDRFNSQLKISSYNATTKIIKAPAGFGKTLLGLLEFCKNNKKIIWVMPRNDVAKSVFNSIIQELGDTKITVELLLTGEIQDMFNHNTNNVKPYSSDIIVTNIDNFTTPTLKNTEHDISSLLIATANVVFDEYHELFNDTAMFAFFRMIMKMRHDSFKSKTLLLSATPFLIDKTSKIFKLNSSEDFLILPNKDGHYPAQHNKIINISDGEIDGDIKNKIEILNTISDAQNKYRNTSKEKTLLIHSNFISERRDEQFDYLIKQYGKSNIGDDKQKSIIGTHLIQASLDVSAKNLYETIFSPEGTLQRIGRLNRWGEYDECNYYFDNPNSRGDITLKNILYTNTLSEKWYNELISFSNNRKVILDEFYQLYNKFNQENQDEIYEMLEAKLENSLENLSKIYPKKMEKSGSVDTFTADGNKLRSDGNNSHFIIVRNADGKWVGPFQDKLYYGETFTKKYDEYHKTLKLIKDAIKHELNDSDFNMEDYVKNSHALKNMSLEILQSLAKYSNTPYLVFNYVYHDELGLIEKEF